MAVAGKEADVDASVCPSEKAHIRPSRDLSFYIVLFIAVIPLWSIPPLSWTFVVYFLRTGHIWSFTWWGKAWFAAALAEAGLASLPEDGFDEETLDGERPGSPQEEIELLDAEDPRAVDFRTVLRTWVPFSHIRKQEMFEWLYWAIFNARLPPLESLPTSHRAVLRDTLDMIQKRSGTIIPDGSNPAAKPLLLTLDPVVLSWRPLAWYLFVAAGDYLTRLHFWYKYHVQLYSKDGFDYLLRVPHGYDIATGPQPVVFMHGLGLGLLHYVPILSYLLRNLPDTPILIPLQPHISQQLFHPTFLTPKGRKETAELMRAILLELGWVDEVAEEDLPKNAAAAGKSNKPKGVTMLSHSNGSYTHAWILKAYPEMITRSCFVDPVTFCSWEGGEEISYNDSSCARTLTIVKPTDVCYNFIYRRCHNGLQLVMRYFVGMELGVANLLQRHFDWSSNSLWYEDIPNARDPSKAKFFLGGNDAILQADRVKRYLTSHGVRKGLWYDPNGRHGSALNRGGEGLKELTRWLKESQHVGS
ncbi:hypothetical protein EWM64_g5252 [Hericium alpestre]|uniref:AB hydrolase-1 domain-containing protein n=1 Tax=Hericium alpestre TaxID=135208 RepID=A0A4Y9ZXW5_9AGAM|nr:hypothetical protein EWM64_g5252 [Hericium alpestre]